MNQSQNTRWFKSFKLSLNVKKLCIKSQQGQLVIEYVLLLTVVTVLAGTLISVMIGQGDTPAEQGLIVRKWSQVVQAIAEDIIDK